VHNFNAAGTAIVVSGGGLSITPSTGTTQGLVVVQNGSGATVGSGLLMTRSQSLTISLPGATLLTVYQFFMASTETPLTRPGRDLSPPCG
jgi:hypothetical protein